VSLDDSTDQLAETLRVRERRLRFIADHSPVLLVYCGADKTYQFVNQPYAERFGLRPQDIVGKSLVEIIGEAAYASIEPYIEAVLRGEHVEFEARIPYRSIGTHYMWTAYEPEFDRDGKVTGFVASIFDITRRKQIEEALRQSKERFSKAFEAGPLAMTITSLRTGRLLEVNETFTRLSGFTREEAVGRTTLELGVWIDPNDRTAELALVSGDGQVRRLKYRFRMKDGTELVGLLSAERLEIGGEPCALTVIENITEVERAEATLRENEERLRLALEAGQVGTWDWDIANDRVTWSDPIYRFHGLKPGQFGGSITDFATLVHPEDRDRVNAAIMAALEDREPYSIETRVVWADGTVRWIATKGKVIFNAAGLPVRMLGATVDTTDRKLAEEELAARERQLSLVYQNVADCLFVLAVEANDGYRFVSINDAFLTITGYSAEQVIGKRIEEVLPASSHALVISKYGEAMRDNKTVRWEEVADMPAGKRVGEVTVTPMGEEVEGRRFLVGAVHDITTLKAAEEVLREGDRRKDEFLAMLAHELRNPLAPIRNAAQLLQRLGSPEPQQRWAREVIDRQVEHLARLVDDLLDVSRITQGKITLRKEKVDLITIIGRAVEASRPLIDGRKHRLMVTLPEQPLRLEGDTTRLTQVMSNLLNNAAKFTPEGGQIWLAAEVADSQIVLRIRDTGIGIAEDLLPEVFDLFRQADRSLDRSQGGLGVGLTLVRRLLELHGGSVRAYSEGPGRGSEFVVRLPAFAEPEMASDDAPTVERDLEETACYRILVVDDNRDSAESVALLLELNGHQVRMAHDGPEALATAQHFRPQVVVLDIGLPEMDGYEVARRLRGEAQMQDVMLIALTGYGQNEDRQRAIAAGFNHHLIKPVDLDSLQALIASQAGSDAERSKRA
jgi:PAS domain S-box-containing protein